MVRKIGKKIEALLAKQLIEPELQSKSPSLFFNEGVSTTSTSNTKTSLFNNYFNLETEKFLEISFSQDSTSVNTNNDQSKKNLKNPLKENLIFNEADVNNITELDNGYIEIQFKELEGKLYTFVIDPKQGIVQESCKTDEYNIVLTHNEDKSKTFVYNQDTLKITPRKLFKANSDLDITKIRELISFYSAYNEEEKPIDYNLPPDYSLVNLKKTYPESDYIFEVSSNSLTIKRKSDENIVLEIFGNTVIVSDPDTGFVKNSTTYLNGNIKEYRDYIPDENGYTRAVFYEYYDNGKIRQIKEFLKKDDLSHYQTITSYNSDGNIVSEETILLPAGIAEELAKDIYAKNKIGLPTTGDNFNKHLSLVNKDNIMSVLNCYKQISSNKNNEDLISSIIKERGLSIEDRVSYVTHIVNCLLEVAKEKNLDISELSKNIFDVLKEESSSNLPARADRISYHITRLINVINGADVQSFDKADGKINKDFNQGSTGDCWLLAAIKGIANTEKGLEILNNSISTDNEGNVTVTLKGVGVTYKITKEELSARRELSRGDYDVRALEIAVEIYLKDHPNFIRRYKTDIEGGLSAWAFEILTGKGGPLITTGTLYDTEFVWQDSQLASFNKENHVAVVAASLKKNSVFTSENGEQIELLANHAYTVRGADDKFVYLINPHCTSETIAVPIDVFKDFFNRVNEFDL